MNRTLIVLLPLCALSACGDKEPSPQQRAADDARDIAMVEAAQAVKPPPVALSPEPLSATDVQKYDMGGAGCSFVPTGSEGSDPVLLTAQRRAAIKLDGRIVLLASDPSGAGFPLGTWGRYVGKSQSLTLDKEAGNGVKAGEEVMRWTGTATLRDAWDQIVYRAPGELSCGA